MTHSGQLRFAFCYPCSLDATDAMLDELERAADPPPASSASSSDGPPEHGIYFHREVVCWSLQKRPVHLITLSSYKGCQPTREAKLPKLFPQQSTTPRPLTFGSKPVSTCPNATSLTTPQILWLHSMYPS
jgi:hypothetical protein